MDNISAMALASKKSEDSFYTFAMDNRRFIMKCACLTCKRLITESDDEWSIALIAFYEAVNKYREDKGKFSSFARMVISGRLKDYFDSQSSYYKNEISTAPFSFDGQLEDEPDSYDLKVAEASGKLETGETPGTTSLQDEIALIEQRIHPYGFTLHEIGGCSPKAEKTKAACRLIIKEIVYDNDLFCQMVRKRNLPFAELVKLEGVTKKTLERHRKYLITAAEIMHGDFPQLAEYIGNL
ncbi:MAG: RNA polymerase subunit sigma [Lachnospiraceae bacterium]|nr:RNA polymerase subunit sigma [Lachnospiraceae bacterium]